MSQAASPFIQEQKFLDAFQQAIETHSFDRMIISQYKGELEHLEKMTLRVISLQNQPVLSCLYRYKTQDVTKNYPLAEAVSLVQSLLAQSKQANLFTASEELQLKKIRRKPC